MPNGDTKTEKSRRTLELPTQATEAFRTHHVRQAKERLTAGKRWQDHGYVFASQTGTQLDASHVRRSFKLAGAENAFTSRDLRILVEETAQPVTSSDADVDVGRHDGDPAVGWCLAEGPVWPVAVVVIDILAEDVMEVPSADEEDAVGALAPGAGDPPLADRIRRWCLDRRCDDPYVGRGEDRVERIGVLGISVSDQELQAVGPLTGVHEDVPGLLDRVGAGNCVTSCDLGIFMDQAAEPVPPQHPDIRAWSRWMRTPCGRVLLERPVWPVRFVVIDVLIKDQPQVPFARDQHPVQALAACAGNPSLRDGVRPWDRTGVWMIRAPIAVNTASNAAMNLASRSRIRNLKLSA